jgi:VWFA-related protein
VFRMQRFVKRTMVLIAIQSLVGVALTASSQTTVEPSPTTTLKVNTRLTLVDVTVTDSKGHPVHGLTQADFTVKEDGKDQPIKNFEEHGIAQDAVPKLPPGVYTNRQAPGTQASNILLLDLVTLGIVDDFRFRPAAFKDAKEASVNFLKTMPEGTRVAVMEMDGSGLHTLLGFTTDRELLVAAVNSATYQRVAQSKWDPPDAPSLPGVPREKPNYTMLCNAMNFQSAQALNAMNQLALFVSGLPGRKNVTWFTVGVPWLTQYQPFSRSQNLICVSDFSRQLQAVYGRLTAERVALYPINPVGVRGEGQLSGNYDSLEGLAKETGGKAHFDNDFVGALREDIASGADYYALSYVPPLEKYDGKYHTIEVKVDRPGVQLNYRRGYTSLDINGPLLEQEKNHGRSAAPKTSFQTAMGYGAPAATQVVFAVHALPSTEPAKPGVIGSLNPELKGKPLVRYSFAFDLPRDKITLADQPDGSRKASFELAIAAYDVQGRVLNSLDEKRSFTLKPDTVAAFLRKPFVVPVDIDLPSGALSVRAGMLDLPSQQMGVVEIPLSITK